MIITTLTGCKEMPMNTEFKSFDVQKDFADNGFTLKSDIKIGIY